jgi:stage II sporulation protein AA (anti-sigma F factor antagonist)
MCAVRDRKPGFDSEYTGTVLKIKLRGEIDHHSAVAVRTAIDDMIRSKRPRELIVDMSAVDFMDSSGLGLIMGRYALMKDNGGLLRVADPSPATAKIMKLAGMERIIKIERTVMGRNASGRVAVEKHGGAKQEHITVTSMVQSESKATDEKRRVKKNAREV